MIDRIRPFVDWAVWFRINGKRFPLVIRKTPLFLAYSLIWLITVVVNKRG